MSKDYEKLNKPFTITSICRADIVNQGYSEKEVMNLTDSDMEYIAKKIADGIMEEFWTCLDIIMEDKFQLRKVK